jgi:hypothetical protein
MRLAMSFLILVVTVLDFRFGLKEAGLLLADMVAGILLALSVIVDHLLPMTGAPNLPVRDPQAPRAERTRTAT